MKTFLVSLLLLLAGISVASAQSRSNLRFGIKFGISPGYNRSGESLLVNRTNPFEEFQLRLFNTKQQFFVEVNAHLKLNDNFFLETGLGYTRTAATYRLDFRMIQLDMPSKEMYMSESRNIIQLPVEIGARLGNLEVTSGFRAIQSLSTTNELSHVKGFQSEDSGFSMGWQMGARYPIKGTFIGVQYLGHFERVGTGMSVQSQSLELTNIPGRWVFSLQYRF